MVFLEKFSVHTYQCWSHHLLSLGQPGMPVAPPAGRHINYSHKSAGQQVKVKAMVNDLLHQSVSMAHNNHSNVYQQYFHQYNLARFKKKSLMV